MTAITLLHTLQSKGVRLLAHSDQLAADYPPGVMTDELRQAIRQHKQELLTLLTQREGDSPANPLTVVQQELVAERAAIMEYDGGLSRVASAALARHGHVIDLPACAVCNGMAYKYADGHIRCTMPRCAVGKE